MAESIRRATGRKHWLISVIANSHLVARSWLGMYPLLFYPLARILSFLGVYGWRLNHPVRGDTEICIEGFRSSANTFFAYMFSKCNDVRIGHHQHVVAQIKRAKKHRIPIVVLIRPPLDVVVSWISRSPNYSATTLLRCYVHFYSLVLDCAEGDVVAVRFETIVREKDFDAVIGAINERFGTGFSSFDDGQDIAKLEDEFFVYAESTTTKPSEQREEIKGSLRELVKKSPWLPRAQNAYERFLEANVSV